MHFTVNWITAHGSKGASMMSENQTTQATLLLGMDSWWVGANIPGKPRTLYPYVGGVGTFGTICREAAEKGYEGLVLARHEAPTTAPR